MIKFSKQPKLGIKVALLGIGSVFVTGAALIGLAVWESGQYNLLAQKEVDSLISADLDHITQGVYNLVQTENEAVQDQVNKSLNIARDLVASHGSLGLSDEKIQWSAIDQFTNVPIKIELPKMILGGKWLGQNYSFKEKSLVVDAVTRLIGETCTIFQRMNERGDMLRVVTTVSSPQGKRAIGTYIPAVNPDGKENNVISEIMSGRSYRGRAYVVNEWYITAYDPMRDVNGNLVGMLYVGFKQKKAEDRVRQAIINTTVGKTGYVYVIGGKGGERGHYIVSQRGERDGENIWESRDSEGRYIIKEIVGKALTLKPGEFATIRYAWQNLGESSPRWKIARLVYYEPWDWVIGTSVYEDELQSYRKMLSDGQTAMISIMGLAGLAVMVLVGMLCFFVAWTIVAPVRKMTQVAKDISQGQMNKVVDIKSNDEIGVLSDAFSTMINRLNQAMEGLKQENREREKTEKELMESERRYKEIFNSTSDALFIHAEDGTIIDVNERMCQMFGCRREDAIGRSVAIFTAGESGYSGEEAKRLIQKAIGEGYQTFEWRSKRVTGELFWVEVALRFCEIAGEKRVIASARDITERKMTEAELLKNEAVQRSMLQGTPVGVCLLKDRKMWKVNDSLCRISGYAEEDLVGEDSRLLYMNDEEYNRVGHIIYERSANNATAFAESRLKRKDGSLVDVEIYLSPFDPNNPEGGVTATIVDVSERKRSEEALKKNEAVLNSMLQGTPVGVALLSKRKFWKVNSSLCRIIGYSEQELLGQETRVLYVDQAGYERVGKDTYEQMMRVGLGMAEAKLKRKDGTPIDVELYLSPFDPENMDAGITATVVDVTERKRAEAEKNRLMTILESTNDLVAMATFDGKVIYLNAAGRKMLGFTRSESLSGYDIEDAHPIAAYYKLQEESIPEACKKGIWDGETVIRTRSGREIPVLQTLMAHRSPKGDIQYLSTIVRDISERKRSEELLKKSEEKYRKIFDNTVEGIYQTTPEGRYLSVNPAFYKMFGFSSAEEMMSTVMDIGHQLYVNPNDRDRMIEMLREYDSISGFEVEVYKKDRSKFWISINVHTVRDADGRIIYFEGTNEDITKRKRVIEELRESEEKFSGVFRFSPEMIAITSLEDGLFFEVNDASVALLGYEKEELLNSTALKMGIWVFPSKRDEMVKEIKEKGAVSQVEQQFRRKDQQIITVLFSGAIIRTMEKEFLLSIVMDISGRKRAEEDLKIAKEQAEYASKAKTNFLLDVSHDIRTPINAIIGFNELLSKTALNATQKEFSGIIRKKSRDLIDLVARIIDISAIEEGKLRLNRSFFNIRDLAVDMAETVGILSREKDLSFFYEVQDDVPKELFGDAVRLRQVLENLCGNSVKYTKKGEIWLVIKTAKDGNGKNKIRFIVKDTGIGISEDNVKHIFSPFFKVHQDNDRNEGIGIGLHIVQTFVKEMGGEIEVRSELGKGTEFSFVLYMGGPDETGADLVDRDEGKA